MNRVFRLAIVVAVVLLLDSNLTAQQEAHAPIEDSGQVFSPGSIYDPSPIVGETPVDPAILPAEPLPSEPDMAWYDPRNVFSPVYWDGNIQFGLNGSEGNAESFSMRSGFELSRETARTNWDIDLTYAKTDQNGIETQHNALLWSNWDYKLANPRWSWFTKFGLEYDEFKNFDLRLSASTGLGYLLVDTPRTQFRPRFGFGVSHEIGGSNDDVVPEAVFGFDFAHKFNEFNSFNVVHDYYPDWSDFANFRQVTDAGWEILLNQTNGLSLKIGVIHRYDSTPEGAEKSDVDYSVLLLWAL